MAVQQKANAKGTTGKAAPAAAPAPARKAARKPALVSDEDLGFLDDFDGEGTENIGAGDISANYLKIAQSNTPEVVEGTIEGLSPGCFFSSLSGSSFGKRVNLIVLRYEVSWMVWAPRDSGQNGLIGRYPVNGIPVVIGEKGKMYDHDGNTVSETQTYHVLVEGYEHLGIMVFSLSSTMLKYGRKWNTLIAQSRTPNGAKRAPIFQNVWTVETILDGNSKGKWYNIGSQNQAAISVARTITRDEYEENVQDAFEVVKHLPAITAGPAQQALEDHSTLDGV